jgi:hypothetical protein
MKVIREYIFEGPLEWILRTLEQSLPDGEQGFLRGTGKSIKVKTTHSDLPDKVAGKEGSEI